MSDATRFEIERIDVRPLTVELVDPFVIASGQLAVADNLLVELTLAGGVRGYGEAAPFPAVTGETEDSTLAALATLGPTLIGTSALDFERASDRLCELAPTAPAARQALECATVDALCRARGVPLWSLWGGRAADREVLTDVTIPITSVERTLALVGEWSARGFRTFKTKVGQDLDADLLRLERLGIEFPGPRLVIDANEGFDAESAIRFAAEVERLDCQVLVFEQPVLAEDLEGLAAVRTRAPFPIVADEAVRTAEDVHAVARAGAADGINLKTMKAGLCETLRMARAAEDLGLFLMIGGMVESRLAMACSLSLVFGLGGISMVDLDTPMLMADDPFEGGYTYDGPRMTCWREPGLGLVPRGA